MPNGPAQPFIEFEAIGYEEMQRKWKNKAPEYMYSAMLTAFRKIGRIMVPRIKAETPVGATGKLRQYTVFQIKGKKEDLRLEFRQSSRSGSFFYGVAVREGTKPHFPPIEALIPWVRKKLGIGDAKQARSVAFLIARKISRVGNKANPYHERVFQSSVGEIRRIAGQEMVNFAARLERK